MRMVKALRALGPIDLKNVVRDPMLRWLTFYPIMISVVMRWGLPALSGFLMERYSFDLVPYYPLALSMAIFLTPLLTGMIIGFLLLDQRDDQTLSALQITPLTLTGYMIYRITAPMILSIILTLIIIPIIGLVEIKFLPLLFTALVAAPLAAEYALFLAAFAANKVQGFAIAKAMGVLNIGPFAAWFVTAWWQICLGLVPLYWPAKVFWLGIENNPQLWIYGLAGLAYQFLLIWVLLRRYTTALHR
jgi:fluoroquinolone transport system permease protein